MQEEKVNREEQEHQQEIRKKAVEKAIQKIQTGSGEDGIAPEMVKQLGKKSIPNKSENNLM